MKLKPGTVVAGPFHSDGCQGVGIVTARGREIWTRVDEPHVPVKVVVGDRISGGYRPEGLTVLTVLKEAR